jgi:prolyl-tRNA synthetase
MRWEKRSRLFLRTSEFLWQEGHTAHASRQEALEETLRMLEVYREVMETKLALPVITGEKSEAERFPGADNTYTCEAMMTDKKALQAGTSHFLGQNFARAFDITFQNTEGEREHAWTTSWGVSTRLIGAIIMTHSDNDGLIIPPRVAPVKAVIVPISDDERALAETYEPEARNLQNRLNDLLGKRSVQVDTQYHMRPGDRFFFHLQRGVPIRIELGQKELENRSIRLVRRDTGEKADVSWEKAPEVVQKTLDSIQDNLYVRALEFRKSNTFHVDSYEEFKKVLENRGGFITAYFGGTREDERDIKSETTATIRCFPLEGQSKGTCFYTGKKDVPLAVFAKAY